MTTRIETPHWTTLVDSSPVWLALRAELEDKAAKSLQRLVASAPGSAEQTRLVGELAALLNVIDAPEVIRAEADRRRAKHREPARTRRPPA